MLGCQPIARGDRHLRAAGQVHAVEVADQRQVRRRGAQGDLLGALPVRIARCRAAKDAVDGHCPQGACAGIELETHLHAQSKQPCLHRIAAERLEVPLEAAIGGAPGVAGVRSAHGERAEVRAAQELRRHLRGVEAAAVQPGERACQRALRVGGNRGQVALHRREGGVQPDLQPIEQRAREGPLVGGNVALAAREHVLDRQASHHLRERRGNDGRARRRSGDVQRLVDRRLETGEQVPEPLAEEPDDVHRQPLMASCQGRRRRATGRP